MDKARILIRIKELIGRLGSVPLYIGIPPSVEFQDHGLDLFFAILRHARSRKKTVAIRVTVIMIEAGVVGGYAQRSRRVDLLERVDYRLP
jgi:hypothetical protein